MALRPIMELLAADTRRDADPLSKPRAAWRNRAGQQIISRDEWGNALRNGVCGERVGLALLAAAHAIDPRVIGLENGKGGVYYLPSFAGAYAAEKARADALEATLWKLLHAGRAL